MGFSYAIFPNDEKQTAISPESGSETQIFHDRLKLVLAASIIIILKIRFVFPL